MKHPVVGSPDPVRELARDLAGQLRWWRLDLLLGSVVAAAVLLVAAAAFLVPEARQPAGWWAFAPAAVALAMGAVCIAGQWRHRRRHGHGGLDRLGATRLDRVRAGLAQDTVRPADREPALRLLLSGGVLGRSTSWSLLGLAGVQAAGLDPGQHDLVPRLCVGVPMWAVAVGSLFSLHRNLTRAQRLLAPFPDAADRADSTDPAELTESVDVRVHAGDTGGSAGREERPVGGSVRRRHQ